MIKLSKIQLGFTLAEVLITLGIIGVVAAMTLPTLIQKYKERETVSRVNQFYSMFSQAYLMAIREHGTFDQWGLNAGKLETDEEGVTRAGAEYIESWNRFFEIMGKYLKHTSFEPLTSEYIAKKDGVSDEINIKRGLQLANGIAIRSVWFYGSVGNCKPNTKCGDLYIVTDGGTLTELREDGKEYPRNKNFAFKIYSDRIEPYGFDNDSFKTDCLTGKKFTKCTGWVIRNKNMDYLHCKDLDMNTKTKCK